MSYSIRIVDLDFYMGYPVQDLDVMYSEFRGTSVTQIPILMLFGLTATGEKICAHIHGVFPYLYIPYDGSEDANSLMYQIANNIDKALNIALNQASSNAQHVYKINLVSGIPMYGYHGKCHQFFKIYLYNPLLIKKVSTIIMNSSTLGKMYQPHETHLNFTLQFMIDYNLHGMSNVNISKIQFRLDPDRPRSDINPELFLSSSISKISVCELEGDILAENILNRQEVLSGNIVVNPGIATIWADEVQRRRNNGEISQIPHLLELTRVTKPTKSHILFKQVLSERLAALSNESNVDNSNISVYPAETPDRTEIQNSSLVDYQTPTSSLELSMDKSVNIDLNNTSLQTNISMNEDAFKLLDILNNLDQSDDYELENEDSILVQKPKNEEDNDLDMSMPWESSIISTKTILSKLEKNNSEELSKTSVPQLNNSYTEDLNKTLIPQLDGECDAIQFSVSSSPSFQRASKELINKDITSSISSTKKYIEKTFYVSVINCISETCFNPKFKIFNMYNFSETFNNRTNTQVKNKHCSEVLEPNITSTKRKYNFQKRKIKKPTLTLSIEKQIRWLGHRVRKLNYKNQVFTLMKKLHEKEKKILLMIHKSNEPIFKVISQTESNVTETGNILYESIPRIKLKVKNKSCLSLDGIIDSSSDEDESKKINSCKHTRSLQRSATISTGPKSENLPEDRSKLQNSSLSNINSVKKQLNFADESLQSTIIEEKLSCTSSPKKNVKYKEVEKTPLVYQMKESTNPKEIVCKQIVHNVSSSGSCISSLDPDNKVTNKSFFNSQLFSHIVGDLSVANKYDKDKNYVVKAGTSKLFTPSDEEHIQSLHSSADKIIDLIKSYQQNTKTNSSFPCKYKSSGSNKSHKSIIITPCQNAISKINVVSSLTKYNIPQTKYEEPFYSNFDDVTGKKEIGYNILKINSKSSALLNEFDSQTDGLNSIRKAILESIPSEISQKKININNIILASCKGKKCVILPVKQPPTLAQIQDWLKKKSNKTNLDTKIKLKKKNIYIPCSPGNEDKAMNASLSLTPNTPSNSQIVISEKSDGDTSKKSTTSEMSPLLDKKCKKRKREIKYKKLSKSLKSSFSSSHDTSQITGVTINNSYGFKNQTADLKEARAITEYQYLTVMTMELHIITRGDFKPDPTYDPIAAIFYAVYNDLPENNSHKPKQIKGIITLNSFSISFSQNSSISCGLWQDCKVEYVDTEENMFKQFVNIIHFWDPDIVAGYEIELLSWGYLIDRAYILGINLQTLLSRTSLNNTRIKSNDSSKDLKIIGRIVLNVWRLMRYEIALQSYSIESVIYHILHKRVPSYSFKDLTFWWNYRVNIYRHQVIDYYFLRVVAILELFDKLDFIGLTSELARLFGILFYEVLSRGSQFRVESMMLRLAKPLNFIPVSPTVEQRAHMKAPEYIPLILEPESKLYNDPIIVLDFQSLYPSIIIAYNYCFTTCVGRIELLGKSGPFEFGATQLKISKRVLKQLLKKDLLNFSPCGVGFVKNKVRDGILPRMLREILDTRLMVKNVMRERKDDLILQKVLHNRQLGLKLIANVSYGYTAANFSGRMPAVEVADSVVSKGRETLQRAIEMVDTVSEWGAKVVYGDTDSLFVLVPGKTRQQAFEIGKKIANAVTQANPDPIKLKLEKVYQPCILQTKKRYVGYMYESVDQQEPVYDAKGIETVRRDGCPAVTKMLEKCLKMLFETKDVSLIKKYILRQFDKIMKCRVSIQDLTFAKEYRGAGGYRSGACVPALELARKWSLVDKRNEPRSGERVPYIIINGPPGLPLIRLVRSPKELLNDPSLRPNTEYYITRVIIPPINRCFNLIGADLLTWYHQMPRKQFKNLHGAASPQKKSTISQYFSTTSCILCNEQTQTGICNICQNQSQDTMISLTERLKSWERNYENCVLVCRSCSLLSEAIKCVSLDCPVLYRRVQLSRDVQQIPYIRELLANDFL